MQFHRLLLPVALSMTALLGACASVSPAYRPDVANQKALSSVQGGHVALGAFTQPADVSTMCRGNGPVEPPHDMSFAAYVQKAFADELQASGKLAGGSPGVTLTGKLTKVDFSSSYHLVHGYWDLDLNLQSSNGRSLSAAEHYEFDTSVFAESACDRSAEALPRAVDQLIHQVVTSPAFPALLAKN